MPGQFTHWPADPIANPGSLRDLIGRPPAVKYSALIQDGREDRRPLESHIGAWVVCTDRVSPFQVEGRDANGNVLARISHEPHDRSQEQT